MALRKNVTYWILGGGDLLAAFPHIAPTPSGRWPPKISSSAIKDVSICLVGKVIDCWVRLRAFMKQGFPFLLPNPFLQTEEFDVVLSPEHSETSPIPALQATAYLKNNSLIVIPAVLKTCTKTSLVVRPFWTALGSEQVHRGDIIGDLPVFDLELNNKGGFSALVTSRLVKTEDGPVATLLFAVMLWRRTKWIAIKDDNAKKMLKTSTSLQKPLFFWSLKVIVSLVRAFVISGWMEISIDAVVCTVNPDLLLWCSEDWAIIVLRWRSTY